MNSCALAACAACTTPGGAQKSAEAKPAHAARATGPAEGPAAPGKVARVEVAPDPQMKEDEHRDQWVKHAAGPRLEEQVARAAIDLGFYISISGIVTFQQAQNVRDMAQCIPLERLLIETDAPWLSPAPHRGKVNHPGRVGLVAAKLAEIRGESLDAVASATYDNANRLFALD